MQLGDKKLIVQLASIGAKNSSIGNYKIDNFVKYLYTSVCPLKLNRVVMNKSLSGVGLSCE